MNNRKRFALAAVFGACLAATATAMAWGWNWYW